MNILSNISYHNNRPPCLLPVAIASHTPQTCGNFPGYGEPCSRQELQSHTPFPCHQNGTQSCNSTYLPYQQNSEHFQDGNCQQGPQLHAHSRQLVQYASKNRLGQSAPFIDSYEIQYSCPPRQQFHQPTYSISEMCAGNNQEPSYCIDHKQVVTSPIETAKISHAVEKPHYSFTKKRKKLKGTKQISSDAAEDQVYSCLTPSIPSAQKCKSHNQQQKSTLPANISSEAKHQSRTDSIPDLAVIYPETCRETQGKYSQDEWWHEFCSLFSEN